jgi:hypothetical protein
MCWSDQNRRCYPVNFRNMLTSKGNTRPILKQAGPSGERYVRKRSVNAFGFAIKSPPLSILRARANSLRVSSRLVAGSPLN